MFKPSVQLTMDCNTMKTAAFGLFLSASIFFAYGAFAEDHNNNPCDAPLPVLGLTLLGQLGAGALGWKLYRSQRAS
jgi:hypothetical protein